MRRPRDFLRDSGGASAVEFAIVSIPLFMLLFGCIEFGRALWVRQALEAAAIAGARCMGVGNSFCATAGVYSASLTTSYIVSVADGWGVTLEDSDITLNHVATCAGVSGFSQVTITHTFYTAVPALIAVLANGTQFTASSCFPNQS